MALNVLAGIAGEKTSPPAARVSAAIGLLDRGWGKPAQAIVGGDDDDAPVKLEQIVRTIVDPKPDNPDSKDIPAAT